MKKSIIYSYRKDDTKSGKLLFTEDMALEKNYPNTFGVSKVAMDNYDEIKSNINLDIKVGADTNEEEDDQVDTESKVIIIGNSPILLENEYGSLIDSYDVVIRINKCPTIGFEKHIGSKTDIWATSKNGKAGYGKNFIPNNYQKLKYIWKRAPKTELVSLPTDTSLPTYTMYKTPEFRKQKHWIKLFDINKEYKSKPLGNMELDTGLLTILTAMKFYSDITIHGFTFYEESNGKITAYYRNSELDSNGNHFEDKWWNQQKKYFATKNNNKFKLKIVNNFISDGKIKKL
jgi:hypothetical protein